ncbi:toluene tolerance family protein [Actibacterium atlanticum]|uniref:Toluene tolerance family protein n=1 Tax=Actibacterium atlanticum TaxID=1461693 RepID=A0A058ZM25_9RHOB|nr:ABC transporter substrate-binding protein [Actibacterium atlanticum]KCV82217.1 toluene tolerance family protein [Actibacterium atlanticum]
MSPKFDRRFVLAALGAAAVARPAAALSTGEAESLVDALVREINTVINSGKAEKSMYRDFEQIMARYADLQIIARSALGPPARSASASQMASFTKAFSGYISRKYGKRFREFQGGRLEVKGAKPVKSFYEVRTMAFLQGQAPFDVTFLVSDKSGRDKFFNMFIEGVNMVAAERTEIGAMLDRHKGDLNALIRDLKAAG